MKIGFDIISDLYLSPDDSFNWEGKATSLYCLIAGNISNNLRVVHQTLLHLSKFYQGIFYIPGSLEYENVPTVTDRSDELHKICSTIRNVASLHNHVVIVDGIAIMGANCWYPTNQTGNMIVEIEKEIQRSEDMNYLQSTLGRLQLHLDVKKVIVVTNSVPGPDLFFGEMPEEAKGLLAPQDVLLSDLEDKVVCWAYGTYTKQVDTIIDGINYVSNSYLKREPYWAKRIEI